MKREKKNSDSAIPLKRASAVVALLAVTDEKLF